MEQLIPYGISKVGLVNRGFAEDEETGQALIDAFLGEYTGVDRFLKQSIAEALTRGYTQDALGRIRWYDIPESGDPEVIKQARSSAARQAQNHKIQATSADITKRAIVDTHNYLEETGRGYLVLTVHDSIIAEVKLQTAGDTIKHMLEIMEAAGPKVFPGIVTPVDADVGYKITKTCELTGLEFSVFSHSYSDGVVTENTDRYDPRVASIVKGAAPGEELTVLHAFITSQGEDWKHANQDLVDAAWK